MSQTGASADGEAGQLRAHTCRQQSLVMTMGRVLRAQLSMLSRQSKIPELLEPEFLDEQRVNRRLGPCRLHGRGRL